MLESLLLDASDLVLAAQGGGKLLAKSVALAWDTRDVGQFYIIRPPGGIEVMLYTNPTEYGLNMDRTIHHSQDRTD